MKHFYEQDKKTVREDAELLADFSDVQNDTVIWEGWHDYQALTGTLPVEAQIFAGLVLCDKRKQACA